MNRSSKLLLSAFAIGLLALQPAFADEHWRGG